MIIKYGDTSNRLSEIEGEKVLVGGCFDLLHIGHVRFLANSKKLGDVLIVALESDEFIEKYKKRNPLHTQVERAEVLSALSCVNVVLLLPQILKSNEEYFDLVKFVKPAYIAVTNNDPRMAEKKLQAKKIGAEVVSVIDYIPEKTSTNLLKIVKELI